MMTSEKRLQRRGLALLTCMAILAVAAVLLITVVLQELDTRKKNASEIALAKADSLVYCGLEWSFAALLEGGLAKLKPEIQIGPAQDKVKLKWNEGKDNVITIRASASVQSTLGKTVNRSQERKLQVKFAGKDRIIESVP